MMLAALALATSLAAAAPSVTLHGRVVEARTAQPVAAAQVRVSGGRETTSGPDGRFAIAGLSPGGLQLRVSAAGYRTFVVRMALGESPAEFEVALEPEAPRVTESVTVNADAAAGRGEAPPPLAREHGAEEIRSVASVVASDPLRAVQALPGVASNDEFNAGFSARGAGFGAAGLYIDGVRLSAPFHTVRDVNDGYSLTVFNTDVLESVSLLPGGAPVRYGDRVGAVLAVRTREGRSDGLHGRGTLGAAGGFMTLEGPLGHGHTASFLVSARKSYLDYIIERFDDDPGMALGFQDLTARLTWHATARHTFSLLGLAGRSTYRNTESKPGAHEIKRADAGTDLLHLSWRAALSSELTLRTTGFLLRETGRNRDVDNFVRFTSTAPSAGLQAEAAWARGPWRAEAGVEARRFSEDVVSKRWDARVKGGRVLEDFDRRSALWAGYAQASWASSGGHVVLTAGARVDRFDASGETVALPRGSLELGLTRSTRLFAVLGGYAQSPSLARLYGEHGNPELRSERSRHAIVALEQRLSGLLRLHLEAYDQQERDLVWNRELDYRVENGRLLAPRADAVLENALSGPSRGLEATLSTAGGRRLSGFFSYGRAHARRSDGSGPRFDSDFDQRDTVTSFLRGRASHGVTLSTAFRYGSGFPLPGFLERRANGVYVAAERNRFGPRPYARLDLRAEKRFSWKRATLDLFLELVNALDRDNERYNEIRSVDTKTGLATLDRDELMPRLPLFGVAVEF